MPYFNTRVRRSSAMGFAKLDNHWSLDRPTSFYNTESEVTQIPSALYFLLPSDHARTTLKNDLPTRRPG